MLIYVYEIKNQFSIQSQDLIKYQQVVLIRPYRSLEKTQNFPSFDKVQIKRLVFVITSYSMIESMSKHMFERCPTDKPSENCQKYGLALSGTECKFIRIG